MKKDIFISYSRRDITFARKLVEQLRQQDYEVWIDWDDIPLTADWWDEIKQGIDGADNFLFLMTPESVNSAVCTLEVAHASARGKRIIPILHIQPNERESFATIAAHTVDGVLGSMLEGRDLLSVARQNWLLLNKLNWIFARESDDFASAYDKLQQTLKIDLLHVKTHTRLLNRALEWKQHHCDPSLLLTGSELVNAENWLQYNAEKDPFPQPVHREYIEAGVLERERLDQLERERQANERRLEREALEKAQEAAERQRQAKNRLVYLVASLVVFLVIALALTAFAVNRQQEAEFQSQLAATNEYHALFERDRANLEARIALSGRAAVQSLLELDENRIDTALLLGIESNRIYDTRESRSSLLTGLQNLSQLERIFYHPFAQAVAYHPSGDSFATGSSTGEIRLWKDGHSRTVNNSSGVWTLAFHPDGSTFAAAGDDGTIRFWDVETLSPLEVVLGDFANTTVYQIAYSPDGSLLAAAYGQGTGRSVVRLWDTRTHTLAQELDAHEDQVYAVAFSRDGRWLASGGGDNAIWLWQQQGETYNRVRRLSGHNNWVWSVAFNDDGSVLASGSADGSLRLWNVASGQPLGQPITDHSAWIRSVNFSADGRWLVTAGDDRSVIIRDAARGNRVSEVPVLNGHSGVIYAAALSPDSTRMISAGNDGRVLLWSVLPRTLLSQTLTAHEGGVYQAVYEDSGQAIISASADSTLMLWDVETQRVSREPLVANGEVIGLARHEDWLAATTATGSLYLWQNFELRHELPVGLSWGVAFSPDGSVLATSSDEGIISLWNAADGTLLKRLEGHSDWVRALIFTRDGQRLISGGFDHTIIAWDWQTGDSTLFPPAHTGAISALAVSPDGKFLASASRDNTIMLWSLTEATLTGAPLTGHTGWVNAVAFSPDGALLASGGADDQVILWDVATRQPIGQPFSGHLDWVWSVAFSPDSRTIASASRDSSIRLWTIDPQTWSAAACAIANRALSETEWQLYLSGLSYEPTCVVEGA